LPKTAALILLIFTILLNGCALHPTISDDSQLAKPSSRATKELQKQINHLISDPALQSAIIGIYIEEIKSGKVVYSHNAQKLLMPASNMKIITSAAALSLLKPDFRYSTPVYVRGEIRGDTLLGDLIVKGSGDPTIKYRVPADTTLNLFDATIAALQDLGIKYITGMLAVDVSSMPSEWGEGWSWDDLWYYYSAKPAAIVLNENCLDLLIIPGDSISQPVKIIVQPLENFYRIENHLITVQPSSGREYDFRLVFGKDELQIWGSIPWNSDTLRISCAVENPEFYFLKTFQKALTESNIGVDSISVLQSEWDYSTARLIVEYQSVTLAEIINRLNKISDNLYAEQLLRTLGLQFRQEGSVKAGNTVVKQWLGSLNVDTTQIFIADGSGLSRLNLVTPRNVAQVLKAMRFSPVWESFQKSLPVGGIDGTLKNRLLGSNAIGHVYAKTGYIGRVRALSGYVFACKGHEFIFSIIANHYQVPTSTINALQDKIVTLLYNFEANR